MSLVTTPTRHSPASSRHSAAIRLLLPDPTGPPMPTLIALAGKQSLPLLDVDRRGELDRDRRRPRLVGQRPRVGGDGSGGQRHGGRPLGGPAGGGRRGEPEQPEGGRG